jgi:hypothetical protein
MPWCGFNLKMATGLTTFAEGLFAATIERAQKKGVTIAEAFDQEVKELAIFLEALEARYQMVKNQKNGNVKTTMREVAAWVAAKDGVRSGSKRRSQVRQKKLRPRAPESARR